MSLLLPPVPNEEIKESHAWRTWFFLVRHMLPTKSIVKTTGSITLGSVEHTDYIYFVTALHTMSLPSPNDNRYTIRNNHSVAITVDTAGAELINGAASITVAAAVAVEIVSDGTNWFTV